MIEEASSRSNTETLIPRKDGRYKPRWNRITHQLERLADSEGWVQWSKLLEALNTGRGTLNAAQIRATCRAHKPELEARKLRLAGATKPRFEIRLKR